MYTSIAVTAGKANTVPVVGDVVHSRSTWQPADPPPSTSGRTGMLDRLVERVDEFGDRRLRVAIDGPTAAGKSTLGHQLAVRLADRGRTTLRASLDDFKRPWRDAHLYDRTSADGYYRNAFDNDAVRRLLLDPAAVDGSGQVALCSIDPITQIDHSAVVVDMPTDGVLVVDGVFAFRPELNDCWDLRIWVYVDPAVALTRGVARDAQMDGGGAEAEALMRDRYFASEAIYIDEVGPIDVADIVIDNTRFDAPVVRRG
jgi:uridine kinase